MERKLASVQRIVKIEPIPNADKIEIATVLGWDCVVPKNEFKKGDLVIYFEIDSLIPYTEWSKFLWKDKIPENINEARYRLRSVKLRGAISQGLIQPMNILNCVQAKNGTGRCCDVDEGDDVSGILNIIKYEPAMPVSLKGKMKVHKLGWFRKYMYKFFPFLFKHRPKSTPFPSFIPKTDEIRVQSVPKIVDEIIGRSMIITEKVDGCSSTFFLNKNEFGVCSRNIELEDTKDSTYWKIAKEYSIKEVLKDYTKHSKHKNIAIQGEIAGEGIQKNPLKLKGQKLFVFNFYDIDTKEYANFSELKNFCDMYKLSMVPIVCSFFVIPNDWDVKTIVEYAKGNSIITPSVKREGIVIRTCTESYSNVLKGRLSFKAINNDYLLSGNE